MKNKNMVKEYSFPVEQTYTKEYLKNNFWKCLYTTGKEQYHYWVILPNNVKPNKLEVVKINELNLTNIGQYVRNNDSPYLEVQLAFENYEYEINPSDWLEKKLLLMGENILHRRIIRGKSTGNYIDVLCSKEIGGIEIISRYTVLKDYDLNKGGANYFCIKASCEYKDYEALSLNILQIVTNWDLINKSDWQMAELLTPFIDDFAGSIKFFVPYSWEANHYIEPNSNFSHYSFEHNIDGKNKGIINAFFYKPESYDEIEDVFKKNFERFEKQIEDVEIEIIESGIVEKLEIQNPQIYELFNATGNLDSQSSNFFSNFIIAIIKTEIGWYYFESIGPKPNFENYYWEVNKRCLQIIINSFNNLVFNIRE